jgi:hypothetical protein
MQYTDCIRYIRDTIGGDFAEDISKLPPEEIERRAKLLYNQRARPVPAG